jgi:hypothetical protein
MSNSNDYLETLNNNLDILTASTFHILPPRNKMEKRPSAPPDPRIKRPEQTRVGVSGVTEKIDNCTIPRKDGVVLTSVDDLRKRKKKPHRFFFGYLY